MALALSGGAKGCMARTALDSPGSSSTEGLKTERRRPA
jgi:hypothetical protein